MPFNHEIDGSAKSERSNDLSRNLIVRILVAAIAIPTILWISYQGGGWLFGMVMVLATLASVEFLIREGFKPDSPIFWWGTFGSLLLISVSVDQTFLFNLTGVSWLNKIGPLQVLVILFGLSAMMLAIGRAEPAKLFRRHSRLMWGILYIGLLYPFVWRVGQGWEMVSGGDSLLFLFGILWVGDTFAMAIGTWMGRHQLAPAVSPNKTIEGFIGGLVGAILIAIVMHFWKLSHLPWLHVLLIAVGCSAFGQLGDLVESMWKRSLDIKDSSSIIPGHGGILDRFDSLLFGAPFMYFYFNFLSK